MKNKLVIYYKAIEIAEDLTNSNTGLCHFLADAVCRVNHNLSFCSYRIYPEEEKNIISEVWESVKKAVIGHSDLLPEIAKHCPEERSTYWFPCDDRDSRIAILKQAIIEYKIEIYSKALELLENQPDPEVNLGFCHVLSEAILLIEADMTWEDGLNSPDDFFSNTWYLVKNSIANKTAFMPEFIKYKPEETFGNYWFNPVDRVARINILKEIIKNLQDGK